MIVEIYSTLNLTRNESEKDSNTTKNRQFFRNDPNNKRKTKNQFLKNTVSPSYFTVIGFLLGIPTSSNLD